jgi:hypothetical protein
VCRHPGYQVIYGSRDLPPNRPFGVLDQCVDTTADPLWLLRRRIQVLEQAQNGALAPLKTKASRRVVPVGDWIVEEIAAHLFYVSALISANLNPKVIQARLGHATIAETMDTYGHLFPDAEDLGRTAVDQTLAPALAEQERIRSAL